MGNLQPGDVRDITVICSADECMGFNEILHVVVKEGEDVDVVLKARGTEPLRFAMRILRLLILGRFLLVEIMRKDL